MTSACIFNCFAGKNIISLLFILNKKKLSASQGGGAGKAVCKSKQSTLFSPVLFQSLMIVHGKWKILFPKD